MITRAFCVLAADYWENKQLFSKIRNKMRRHISSTMVCTSLSSRDRWGGWERRGGEVFVEIIVVEFIRMCFTNAISTSILISIRWRSSWRWKNTDFVYNFLMKSRMNPRSSTSRSSRDHKGGWGRWGSGHFANYCLQIHLLAFERALWYDIGACRSAI